MFTLRGCDRLLNWVAQAQAFGVPFSKGAAFERCRALLAKNAGGPHKPGQSPALRSGGGQRARRRGWGEIHPEKYAGMGRRSSEEEKRDSSLRGPARKQRAQEKTGPLRS